jgi:hypothetical protein
MKTKFFILALLCISITVIVIESCQKAQTPTTAVSSSPSLASNNDQQTVRIRHSLIDIECNTFYYTYGGECSGPATDCLCDVNIYGEATLLSALNTAIAAGTSSAIGTFFSDTSNVRPLFPILLSANGHTADSLLCSGNFYITPTTNSNTGEIFLLVYKNGGIAWAFVMPYFVN